MLVVLDVWVLFQLSLVLLVIVVLLVVETSTARILCFNGVCDYSVVRLVDGVLNEGLLERVHMVHFAGNVGHVAEIRVVVVQSLVFEHLHDIPIQITLRFLVRNYTLILEIVTFATG